MIVLCVGMPRAGSGWHYNLIHDLMQTTGCADARDIRDRFHLESVLTEVNCNIGVLSPRRLAVVSVPALLGNTFVIKAHSGPTAASRLLARAGLLRITYIYRDPRDAMLSAFNYGQRALSKGRPNAFSHLTDFDRSLNFITDYVHFWESWTREKNVLISRYEDLLTNYEVESRRVVKYLGLDERRPEVAKVIENYRPGNAEGQQGTHFFKGQIGRFRESYSPEQQQTLVARLGHYLSRMGYPA
jgi:sulfotransferase family protein